MVTSPWAPWCSASSTQTAAWSPPHRSANWYVRLEISRHLQFTGTLSLVWGELDPHLLTWEAFLQSQNVPLISLWAGQWPNHAFQRTVYLLKEDLKMGTNQEMKSPPPLQWSQGNSSVSPLMEQFSLGWEARTWTICHWISIPHPPLLCRRSRSCLMSTEWIMCRWMRRRLRHFRTPKWSGQTSGSQKHDWKIHDDKKRKNQEHSLDYKGPIIKPAIRLYFEKQYWNKITRVIKRSMLLLHRGNTKLHCSTNGNSL